MKMFFLAHAQHEESPRSVLIRTAQANGFESVAAMARRAGSRESLQPIAWQLRNSKLIQELGRNADLNGDKFVESFYEQVGRTRESPINVQGLQIPANAIHADSFSYCSDCAKIGTWYSVQDLVWLASCPYHDRKYVSKCQGCERPIRWTHLRGHRCQCGFDFKQAENPILHSKASHLLLQIFRTKDQQSLDRFIFALRALRYSKFVVHNEPIVELAARIATCEENVLDEFLVSARKRFPCLPIRPLIAVWMTSSDHWIKSQVSRLLATHSSTRSASEPCCCSDVRLHQDEMCCAVNVSVKKLRSLLTCDLIQRTQQRKTRWIYSSKNLCRLLEREQSGLAAQLASHCDGVSNVQPCELMTVEAVAAFLGVYPSAIRNAILCGFMGGSFHKKDGSRTLIPRAIASEFNDEFVFIGQVANELDLPRTTLSAKLLHLGVKPVSGPIIDGGLVTIYRKKDIDDDVRRKLRTLRVYKTNAGRKAAAARREDARSSDVIPSTVAAQTLGVSLQDLKHLEKLGYLVRSGGLNLKRHYTAASVSTAKLALADMLPLKVFSLEIDMSPPTFSRRFLLSGYVEHIRVGAKVFIPSHQMARVIEHRKSFLSFCEADELLGSPFGHSSNLTKTGRLNPVSETDQGYVSTVRLLRRCDVDKLR